MFCVHRSIMWASTTPQMLYALSIMSELSQKKVWTLLALDVVMILTGLGYQFLTGDWFGQICLNLSNLILANVVLASGIRANVILANVVFANVILSMFYLQMLSYQILSYQLDLAKLL